MDLRRFARHMTVPHRMALRAFPPAVLEKIERAIGSSEKLHDGELRFAVEAGMDPGRLWRGLSPRGRAIELFSDLRVWDTEHNSGVLIYVQLLDRTIEIVADRGINARVPQASWDGICRKLEAAFRQGKFEDGALAAIGEVTALLTQHFPASGPHANELSDKPVVL
jgi:uncharacterized membrane protein